MEEQVKPNPWGNGVSEVKQEVSVETPKSNKLTYILIGLGALLVLAVAVLGFVVYKQAMTNPPTSTNTSSVSSSKDTSSLSTSSSVSTSSNTASVSVSSAITTKYYKYNTNNGKYVSFDYPDGAKINITAVKVDDPITAYKDIAVLGFTKDIVQVGLGVGAIDECRTFTFDPTKPNQIGWELPKYDEYYGDPSLNGDKGMYNLKTGTFIFSNPKFEYMVIDLNDLANSNTNKALTQRFTVLEKQSNGTYKSGCTVKDQVIFTPKWTIKFSASTVVEPVSFMCTAKNTEDVKKCTEVLDRFITTLKVK